MSTRVGFSALAGGVATLVLAGAAAGAGPWPGLAQSLRAENGVIYAAAQQAGATTVTATRGAQVVATKQLKGRFGIPAVTLNGSAGGLSADGKLLVLAEPPNYSSLKKLSRFLVLRAPSLRLVRTVTLRGDFGYDALSPDGRTLYLLQHRSVRSPDYAVRAYNLATGRLYKQVIVDKRTPDEKMNGYPVARTTTATGDWVYTLYSKASGEPFVHALNAKGRYAMCVDFAWTGTQDDIWLLRLSLNESDQTLTVLMPSGATAAKIDTRTLNVLS